MKTSKQLLVEDIVLSIALAAITFMIMWTNADHPYDVEVKQYSCIYGAVKIFHDGEWRDVELDGKIVQLTCRRGMHIETDVDVEQNK